MSNFGIILKKIREFRNISARQLALQVGCTPANISKIENGKSNPSEQLIKSICQALDVPTEQFGIKSYDPIDGLKSLIQLIKSKNDPDIIRFFDYLISYYFINEQKRKGALVEKMLDPDTNVEVAEQIDKELDFLTDIMLLLSEDWFQSEAFRKVLSYNIDIPDQPTLRKKE